VMGISDYLRETEEGIASAATAQVSFRDLLNRPMVDTGPMLDEAAHDLAPSIVLKAPEADDLDAALRTVRQPDEVGELFSPALQTLALGITQRPEVAGELIQLVSNQQLSTAQRLAVIDMLQEMSFSAAAFAPSRPAYLEALRGLIEDSDKRLRRRALGILSRQKDDFTQRRLVAGLQGDAKPLVPTAEAIELLSNDIHADHYPLLRRLAVEAPTRTARVEAIGALAGDPSSADLLSEILADTTEDVKVRQACALVLHAVAPEDGARQARNIVLADDEDDKLRATSLTSLTHSRQSASGDAELVRKAQQLRETSRSRAVKRASSNYLDKYGD
jgi:HEAT repeat protein